jgi:hypothetical protein
VAIDGIDIPMTFGAVTSRLIIGSRPRNLIDLQALRTASVSHILNVCEVDDYTAIGEMGVAEQGTWWTVHPELVTFHDYLWNPAVDDGKPKSVAWFQASLKWALAALAEPGWCLYVHCNDGVNRGPSTAYAILRAWGLTWEQALVMIVRARPIDVPPIGLRYRADAEVAIAAGW